MVSIESMRVCLTWFSVALRYVEACIATIRSGLPANAKPGNPTITPEHSHRFQTGAVSHEYAGGEVSRVSDDPSVFIT